MILARIVGTVVSTRKDPRLEGKSSCRETDFPRRRRRVRLPDRRGHRGRGLSRNGAGGFRQRGALAADCKDRPVDAAIIGIVDTVNLDEAHEGELAASKNK